MSLYFLCRVEVIVYIDDHRLDFAAALGWMEEYTTYVLRCVPAGRILIDLYPVSAPSMRYDMLASRMYPSETT